MKLDYLTPPTYLVSINTHTHAHKENTGYIGMYKKDVPSLPFSSVRISTYSLPHPYGNVF